MDGARHAMIEWYVVHSRPHAEAQASEHLRRQGYTVYLPVERACVRHARRREWVQRPLFSRYLFVAVERAATPWRPIMSTVGVAGVVKSGDVPVPVPIGVIDALRERERAGEFDRQLAADRLKPGGVVRVADGPFADRVALLSKASGAERVCILFDMMGRQVRSWLSASALEAVYSRSRSYGIGDSPRGV